MALDEIFNPLLLCDICSSPVRIRLEHAWADTELFCPRCGWSENNNPLRNAILRAIWEEKERSDHVHPSPNPHPHS